jgi:hypothetical protein
VRRVVRATRRGYALAAAHPRRALNDLLAANPDLDRAETAAQLAALNRARAFQPHLPARRLRAMVTRGFDGP